MRCWSLGRLVDTLAEGLGGQAGDRLMVGAVLVFFPIFGFLATDLLAESATPTGS